MNALSQQTHGEQMIMQLSHKKMQRRKGVQLFDKFTTIQEFLAHGNRDMTSGTSTNNRPIAGILSVRISIYT
jgi:hypothetical protein